jgi:hypothetical protein
MQGRDINVNQSINLYYGLVPANWFNWLVKSIFFGHCLFVNDEEHGPRMWLKCKNSFTCQRQNKTQNV